MQQFIAIVLAVGGILGLISAIGQLIDFAQSGKWSALVWTAAFTLLTLSCAAGIAWRSAVGRALQRLSGSPNPRDWIAPAIGVIAVVAALLWSGLVALGADSTWIGQPDYAPVTPSPSRAVPPGLPWKDDFSGQTLSPDKWRPSPLPTAIYAKDGALRFDINIAPNKEPITQAELKPVPTGFLISQVDAKLSAIQSAPSRGGVVLFLRQASGTITGVGFGPSPSGPVVEPWICAKETCSGDYGDWVHPPEAEVPLSPGAPATVRATQTGQHVQVQVGGLAYNGRDDPSPIVDIRFRLDAYPGDHWLATLDDLTLTPAAG